MSAYILRRFLYAIPILIGVNLITFLLFFLVTPPDDMARAHLGHKHTEQKDIENWKIQRGYDKGLFWNEKGESLWNKATDTIFVNKSASLFVFDFGVSDEGRNIGHDIKERMGASLSITVPLFLVGLILHVAISLLVVLFRKTYINWWAIVICVALMSISGLFYYIAGQFVLGRTFKLLPISGYSTGLEGVKFVILPILCAQLAGMGAAVRVYTTYFKEQMGQDYVRTVRAMGLSEVRLLFTHVLKNTMLPILTGVVASLPFLFIGSLVLEAFFAIPGLGDYIIEAIQGKDFAVVRSMVFLGSVLYIFGLLLTDISYTLFDPRVRLK